MYRIISFVLLSTILTCTAYGGQTTIQETETGITVEYAPAEEDSAAAVAMKEQDEKQSAVEEANRRKAEEKLARQRARNPKNDDGKDAD